MLISGRLQIQPTTYVQALTLAPTVRDGVIVYEDSPLVRAVRAGHVLVVDEADKAPTQVKRDKSSTCDVMTDLFFTPSGDLHPQDPGGVWRDDPVGWPQDRGSLGQVY